VPGDFMFYESIDQLQQWMTEEFFAYARDSKKAAGRALGILTFVGVEQGSSLF